MRRRITYANVVATLALVLAMSSGAVAASSYLITSTKQIKPNVLRALKGNKGVAGPAGRTGATGAAGAPGVQGVEGKQGAVGSFETTLAAGKTETGGWGAGVTAAAGEAYYYAFAAFPIPLPEALDEEHVVYVSGSSATHCSGIGHAEAGYLCVYGTGSQNANVPVSDEIYNGENDGSPGSGIHGFAVRLSSIISGPTVASGVYAVTAP